MRPGLVRLSTRRLAPDRPLLGRAIESFTAMEVDLARQFDRVRSELPSDPVDRAATLRSRIESRLVGRPESEGVWNHQR